MPAKAKRRQDADLAAAWHQIEERVERALESRYDGAVECPLGIVVTKRVIRATVRAKKER